ncbi:hypothetical protein GCM10010451_35600 [Streptomyces virens]|jgi:hypothetical protein|uniref:Uncharacterized protein n=2 Tax=Streptomyces TaxID=1883 RepID=A0A514JK51_9ACTN|nr:hypothetical protein [Streptomyces calvus]MBA8946384.1 hypothetical protein [Streptomyces calvus]MBA8980144.1 hypothetical protein [Streptomyces calvus]QDI67278.1 hypothetical protein CD934_00215 [Streptomyces calvus]GGP73775.1 hypothetical protein GCM10010247_53900 [Streptomyces calvus]
MQYTHVRLPGITAAAASDGAGRPVHRMPSAAGPEHQGGRGRGAAGRNEGVRRVEELPPEQAS